MTTKQRIYVTQEDIDKSRKHRTEDPTSYLVCRHCAVAVALSRTFEEPVRWAYTSGHVINLETNLNKPETIETVYTDRNRLNRFIDIFDGENKINHMRGDYLKPFDFKVEVEDYD